MHTQSLIQPHLELAKAYLKEKRIKEINFSRSTYQVQVVDKATQDPTWTFIQLNNDDEVQDCFCSCQTDPGPICEHLAAAIFAIYKDHGSPLHKRYEHSFWKHLCLSYAKQHDYDSKKIVVHDSQYELKKGRSTQFSIQAKSEEASKYLKELLKTNKNETEETSIKFSNLPKEELEKWKEGRPSEALRFELSFWSDLAKWLMILQDMQEPYTLSFQSKDSLPSKIDIKIKDLKLFFLLSPETLISIIPYLNSVKSPLKVHESSKGHVEKIEYDAAEKSLRIFPSKKTTAKKKAKGKKIGDWLYSSQEGFMRAEHEEPSTEKKVILSHQVDEQLEKNTQFFKKHLANTSIEVQPISPKYQVRFDGDWNLHVDLYLFEPEDFSKPHSVFFGRWTYVEDKGFFRLQNAAFKQPSLFIPRDKVSEFVHQHRLWLNTQKGFETHLATLQTQIQYHVNPFGQLIFTTNLATGDEKTYDFGDWVFVHDQGFYTKVRQSTSIANGQTVLKKDVAKFIEHHQADLEGVKDFFSSKCPVEKTSVALHVNGETQEIVIEPTYHFHPEYEDRTVLFFDTYTYVTHEGFFQIPHRMQLPPGLNKKSKIMPKDLPRFFSTQFQKIKPFVDHVDPRLQIPENLVLSLESRFGPFLKLKYANQNRSAQVEQIYETIKKGHPYYLSEAGLVQVNHPRFAWIADLKPDQLTDNGIHLSPIDVIRIEAMDAAFSTNTPELSKSIYSQIDLTLPPLTGFKAKLRPYQQVGLNWLWKLLSYRLSGILCDDMGLGKTLQSIALMAALKNRKEPKLRQSSKAPKKKFLIVCPTSVIYHWQDKLKEFYPKFKILTFYGLNRSIERFQQQFDILLTTYGILRIDQKLISKFDFEIAIYDELQVAKNHRSLTYAALMKVSAKMKLGLTGTPIENNLRELKALMDLIVPTYLPHEEKFRDYFINPIERDQDDQKVQILKKMIEPFILRRKKEDVLMDLPKKTEQISHCELSADQAKLYNHYLSQSKDKLLQDLQDTSKAIPYMHVFALLNQLKQICNHPKSIDPEKYHNYSSGKWDLFVELLNEARASGQKVVVFSQYLKMLDIILEHLKKERIDYATIRGSTQNRAEQLQKFQTDPKCEVFVASLKAVGLGVDLTAASVVIHYDRWWNAARENQATDRVHRIGQQRGVQVFKMVTLNTLEETIDRIISTKGKLMEDVVGTSDENQIKLFSRQDLIDILQSVHKEIYENA